ncbi:uncharacterized protein PRCAT00005658001 [Priceomyces carsonii]|uniref:uncharacterized protein n=1 Tax=Priceomyces carsonii TaxID=28549 RepID=UPI002ED8EA56|nr:unnamed protein product [Priceomyces carsonii]
MPSTLQKLKFYLKSTLYGSLIAGCALYGVIASIVLRIIGKKEYAQYTVAKVFYFACSSLLGLKITIKNEKYLHEKPAIIISNHQSALDIYVLGKIFQVGYTVTAKKALQYVPLLGWFMLASGTFFLDRTRGEKARKVLDKAFDGVKAEKRGLFIFPEGTRSATSKLEMLPFKKGSFYLAKQGGLPIIPVVVSNTSDIFSSKNKIFNGGEIFIEVLEPMSTDGLNSNEEVSNFCAEVRSKMLEKLKELGYSKVNSNTPRNEPSTNSASSSSEVETEVETEVVSEESPLVVNKSGSA